MEVTSSGRNTEEIARLQNLRSGIVALLQRLGSALNLDIHLHMIVRVASRQKRLKTFRVVSPIEPSMV